MFMLQVQDDRVIVRDHDCEGSEKQMRDSRRPVRSRLPWFRCLHCQARLVPIDVVDGKTCVRLSPYAVSFKVQVTCERCGNAREFVSMGTL
jgi:hypothetical protein